MNMSCIHTNKHILTCKNMHKTTSPCTAGTERKEKGRFSTVFSPSQSHSRWPQVYSNLSQSKVMMSSHFFHIWALICCCFVTLLEKQPALFTWELYVIHTEAGSKAACPVWELLTENLCYPGALASTKHPHHHQLFTIATVHPCNQVHVFERMHISVCHSVCDHDMLSSDLWGATFHPPLSQNLLFLFASWNMGSFLWIFTGHELDPLLMDSVQLIYAEQRPEGSLGWEFLLTRVAYYFCFTRTILWGYKPLLVCFCIFFVDFSKCLKQITYSLCPGDI